MYFMPYYINILANIYKPEIYQMGFQFDMKCLGCLQEGQDVSKEKGLYAMNHTSHFLEQLTFVSFTYEVSLESFFEERMTRTFLKVLENNWAKPTHHTFSQLYILWREKMAI